MGYRSEVILAIGPEVMPQFMVTMAKSREAREMCWADHDHMVKDYGDIEGAFLFRWDGIKWYDTYEGVSAIQDFIQWCDEETIPTGKKKENGDDEVQDASEFYRFVRIGEELDDSEAQGWGFDIHIVRSIEY
jgi:hypothetical protein